MTEHVDELTVLMELRMAFGPGTRLWAQRSREELCYDWLCFKARADDPCLRRFAHLLYAQEANNSQGRCDLAEIRRRIAAVLRAHRIGRTPRSGPWPRDGARPEAGLLPASRNGSLSHAVSAGPEILLPPPHCRLGISLP